MPRTKKHAPYRKKISTRNNGVDLFDPDAPKRHRMQAAYDYRSQFMSSDWLTNPVGGNQTLRVAPHLGPRLISNHSNHCYQNSVYQALMHIPIFLQWISRHQFTEECDEVDPPCVRCSMRVLMRRYWGTVPLQNSIADDSIPLQEIREQAYASGLFQPHQSGSPGLSRRRSSERFLRQRECGNRLYPSKPTTYSKERERGNYRDVYTN
ncbi:hypothetical protein P171DRAFT_445164 [Karstenula rhodostoma CBS 690.94]|uniref:Peptidase C19 ubiquitin carboxyl-terminal hydrolase domain-containing protein n=1 Tax=Karstenula rhodostoma CBS 690.94 TaxID=1392251 RepID=A0A9P4UC02_9PLEO|nr:hypothetical protein P171DRAFT_445164 [Karstenula rhodostoma CBS 690.94]